MTITGMATKVRGSSKFFPDGFKYNGLTPDRQYQLDQLSSNIAGRQGVRLYCSYCPLVCDKRTAEQTHEISTGR